MSSELITIDIKSIRQRHDVRCPACQTPVLHVDSDSASLPKPGAYWLLDGDSIASGDDHGKPGRGPSYATLQVGACYQCAAGYFAVVFAVITRDFGDAEDYLMVNTPLLDERNFLGTAAWNARAPESWLIQEHPTPGGFMHTHSFGLFPLKSAGDVYGPHGVSRCASSVSPTWRFATKLAHERAALLHVVNQKGALRDALDR